MTPHMKLDEKAVGKYALPWSYDEFSGDYLDAGGHLIDLGDEAVWRHIIDAVNAAHAPQGGVRVKPLAWERNPTMDNWTANTLVGNYLSQRTISDVAALWRGSERLGTYKCHEDAKAAAQADYEARILSALTGSDPQ